ncbi:MAG: transglycosylase domain-containing protein [Bacillota bacterium]
MAQARQQTKRRSLGTIIGRLLLGGAVLTALAVILLLAYVTFWPLETPQQPLATTILAQDGQVLTTIYEDYRYPVALEDISQDFLDAVIAVEDSRFYRHPGIDPIRLGKAIIVNIQRQAKAQGGSTITQQLARNLYLTLEKSYIRKLKEMVIALQLERHYSKDEILEMYVNENYMGHGIYGIQSAAQFYYGKDPSELTMAQSTMLAGVIQIPEVYSPINNFEAARKRQRIVLNRLVAVGRLTEAEADAIYAREDEVRPVPRQRPDVSAGYVKQAIIDHLGKNYLNGTQYAYRGGLTVQTTIDLELQAAAEKAVKEGIEYLTSQGVLIKNANGEVIANVALVALDPKTGEIKAMVGGKDYYQSTYNRVYAKRPPGSAFKPLLYAEALGNGRYTLATPVRCEPTTFEIPGQAPWQPRDFGGKYHDDDLTIREAIVQSDNVIPAKVINEIGPQRVVELAKQLGIPLQASDAVLSLSLGTRDVSPLELATAYAAFANGGLRLEPLMIKQISDPSARVWETAAPKAPVQVLDERVAWLITDVLQDVISEGTGQPVKIWYDDARAAAKTGTTGPGDTGSGGINSAWIAGYTPDLVTVVYLGGDDYNQAITQHRLGGGNLAGPIWAKFMARAASILERTPQPPQPEGITQVRICKESGQRATFLCPRDEQLEEYFLEEFAPSERCPVHSGFPIPGDGIPWWERLFPDFFGRR